MRSEQDYKRLYEFAEHLRLRLELMTPEERRPLLQVISLLHGGSALNMSDRTLGKYETWLIRELLRIAWDADAIASVVSYIYPTIEKDLRKEATP
jgi:hypothetical protein